jgi:hypothetical protein
MFRYKPDELAPNQTLREVAAILALGVLRLRAWIGPCDDPQELHSTCLDLPAETSLSVRVVNGTNTDERNET